MKRVEGKVVIVTGAAQGQGAAELKLMAQEGAKVVGTDKQIEKLQKLVDEINAEYGDVALAIQHDVSDEKGWQNVVEQTIKKFGKIDVLVNNAGYLNSSGYMEIENIDMNEWNKTLAINAAGNFLGIKSVIPYMKKAKSGSIINISSISGIVGGQDGVQYTASKGASRLLTKGAAVELAQYNIRVNSVHPGLIDTPMAALVFANKEELKTYLADIPLGHAADPIDIAYPVLFLASDESKYMTGAEVVVDGGITAK